jgi:uracil-DNA glycosylase
MRQVTLTNETDWEGWRQAARALVLAGVEPSDVSWSVGGEASALPAASGTFHVPRTLVSLCSVAIQAREKERFGLMYSLVWRANAGEKLLEDADDPDLALVRRMALTVRADAHRMRTLMRFLPVEDGRRFLGWFEPAHFVLPANALLMARRFPELVWSVVTPDGAAHWDGSTLLFGSGLRHAADDEALQAWWERHRERLLEAATGDVSVPEAEALNEAPRPPDRPALGPVVFPMGPDAGLVRAGRESQGCRRCPLYEPATQTVFGEGPTGATVMFLGEQPGDQEDTIGRPFVGPAGQMMDRAMEEAGIDRRAVYVTNAVKHFKFTPRGRRRIHQTPEVPEIQACGFWLDVERGHVKPSLLVLMGGSAARAVLGRAVTISRERGRAFAMADGQTVFVTVHPSFLLRIPDAAAKAREYEAFVRDLRTVREMMGAL